MVVDGTTCQGYAPRCARENTHRLQCAPDVIPGTQKRPPCLKNLCNVIKSQTVEAVREFPEIALIGALRRTQVLSGRLACEPLQYRDGALLNGSHEHNIQIRGPGLEAVRKGTEPGQDSDRRSPPVSKANYSSYREPWVTYPPLIIQVRSM